MASSKHFTPDGSVRYSTRHALGTGGEGSVFLGFTTDDKKEVVAVKVGHPGSSASMMREARILGLVAGHPNVMPKYHSVHEGRAKRGIIVSVSWRSFCAEHPVGAPPGKASSGPRFRLVHKLVTNRLFSKRVLRRFGWNLCEA
jgi:hypothetical protein